MAPFFPWIAHYGYAGLFGIMLLGIVGLPLPVETLLVFSGYLISQGKLHPLSVFLVGFAGSACGISLSYYLGITLGNRFIPRYGRFLHLTDQHMARANLWFHRMGNWVLTFGYFVPGVRHVTALAAGMSGLEYPIFAFHAYCGAAIWVATFLTLGYLVGDRWQEAFGALQHYLIAVSAAAAIIVLWIWLLKRRKNGT